jgi:hypothetical protein
MTKQSVALRTVIFVVFLAGAISVVLPATPCRGSDRASTEPTITLGVDNEPLQSVLGQISKTTGWEIKVPGKWMDKPITQTLNRVSMDEGVRFILKDAGVENLLLIYDENKKTITVYDTEIQQGQPANRPTAQGDARPPVFSASGQSDPMLKRREQDTGAGPSQRTTRARNRKQANEDE